MNTLSSEERSRRMGLVRSRGNKSTELVVEATLATLGLPRWLKHPAFVPGRPDFYFPSLRLAVFIDGCFWHACPSCGRLPKTRTKFWRDKIDSNRRRDRRVRAQLWRDGFHVIRIWEHDLKAARWKDRLVRLSSRVTAGSTSQSRPHSVRRPRPAVSL